jgi:hypothetical protein
MNQESIDSEVGCKAAERRIEDSSLKIHRGADGALHRLQQHNRRR